MGRRRRARESALQILFQLEFDSADKERTISQFWEEKKASKEIREYSIRLVKGILDHQKEIDELIQSISANWRISRMAVVDRTVLRIAVFEFLYETHIAPAVIINEALEITKKFSSEDAASFVNGILDGVRKQLKAEIENDSSKEGIDD